MNTTPGRIATLLLFCCASLLVFAQNGANPFELAPRMPAQDTGEAVDKGTGNPFELVAPTSATTAQKKSVKPARKRNPISEEAAYRRFLFVSIMGVLLMLTLLMTLFRSFFRKTIQAFSNDTMMNQVYRDRESVGALPFLMLYTFFFVNGGLFIYFLAKNYNAGLPGNHFQQWLYYTLALVALLSLKHLLLNIIGFVFPVEKEVRLYNFLIMIFGIVIGLILTPINILLAYGPESIFGILILIALIVLGSLYLFRYARSLFIADRFLFFHRFHFLLYICTVEIAPVMVLVKLVLNQI